ncbi:acyl-CoA thioesterase [Aspergillus luchuensis]|uniref:Capsule polysaccharide biosynthesis protein n=1 Tax=Aspergillus kawachii TaxID=1069201 RepID=A0A146FHW4_ASPKA|nr:uncharacterized protein AKAW2_81287S [Aspergillus luchuensis]BCS05486.1 hypothetical protein AKAW2_81287S [Aspergillus luchuensis]BCS17040.1 hypothetical protein ALUC_81247S [Aspergillus luchuensis]GAA89110.1 hypothetical protein AKAW_07224 [Aspergillus luchuensis IFO 4308]GAT24933.1 hypothetical protein RIB2604_01807680 [Aspergillus luchuensis]
MLLFLFSILILILFFNAKSLPLVYSFQLLPSLYRILQPRNAQRPKELVSPHPINTPNLFYPALPSLFRPHTSQTHCPLPEIDLNLHKSNSTFFTDADLSRARLLSRLLGPALASLGGMPMLAAVQARFLREIRPFQRYCVTTRILAWDQRSLWTVTYFLRREVYKGLREVDLDGGPTAVLIDGNLRRGVLAVLVSRYVVKAGRVTVPPVEVFKRAGLLVDDDDNGITHNDGDRSASNVEEKEGGSLVGEGGKNCRSIDGGIQPQDEEVWPADRVQYMIGSAMEFIGECML